MKITLAIGADHAAFDLKEILKKEFAGAIDFIDVGTNSTDRVDYPDYAEKACHLVTTGKASGAILVCGSGIGMAIAANKIHGIRATMVESEAAAKLSKEHNDVNVLCLGARLITPHKAKECINAWLGASFEGGRHTDRVKKISALES